MYDIPDIRDHLSPVRRDPGIDETIQEMKRKTPGGCWGFSDMEERR